MLARSEEGDSMTPASKTLAVIRTLSAIWYFVGALLVFLFAAWLAGPVGNFWWPFDIIAALFVWSGLQWVRRGCEELSLNETKQESAAPLGGSKGHRKSGPRRLSGPRS
jgi:hypothetical protein